MLPHKKIKIIVVDDELSIRESLRGWLQQDGYQVETAAGGPEALAKNAENRFDIMLIDVKMPEMDGLTLLQKIKEIDSDIAIVMMTAHGDIRDAIEAIKLGAYDYITKPYEPEEILSTAARVMDRRNVYRELDYLRRQVEESRGFDKIISQNKTMLEIFQLIKKVAFTSTNIMITGESGTGKELIARSIHRTGNRKDGPFVAINCAAIPSELMESEMFGHERGAFTGAHSRTIGKFEHANGEGSLPLGFLHPDNRNTL